VATAISELQALLSDRRYTERAAEIAEIVRQENGTTVAVDAIERVLTAKQ
jgi:UDP:flavonoid glycosyltransferase YjiC (YdhE family)